MAGLESTDSMFDLRMSEGAKSLFEQVKAFIEKEVEPVTHEFHALGEGREKFGTQANCERSQGRCGAWGGRSFYAFYAPNSRWADRGQSYPGGNTVGVSTVDSRTIPSEATHNPVLTSKPGFWSQPGSPGRRSRIAARRWRRAPKGILHGA